MTYEAAVKSASRGLIATYIGGVKGQHTFMQGTAQALPLSPNIVANRGKAVNGTLKAIVDSCDEGTKTHKQNKSTVSMMRKVATLDIDGKYLNPWAAGDFTVSLRAAYEAIKGAKAPRAVTAATIAKYVQDACEKHGIDIDYVVAILTNKTPDSE